LLGGGRGESGEWEKTSNMDNSIRSQFTEQLTMLNSKKSAVLGGSPEEEIYYKI
jgi:hypothetical protein